MSHEMRSLVVPIAIAVQVTTGLRAFADQARQLDEKTALAHLDKGVIAFRAGKFDEALRELTLAHKSAPDTPNPYRWLALTEIQLGDCTTALGHIDEFLARVPPDDERVAEMARWRDLCKRTGVLRVDSTPTAATLYIDGAVVGATPYKSLAMRSGTHTLVADRDGFRSASRTIDLAAGSELDVHLTLSPVHRSITDRWWFWPAVGVVALGVTGGIIYVATRDGELPPIHCTDAGCMP
jgi:tetratricopeptide (TPR) repeat protein